MNEGGKEVPTPDWRRISLFCIHNGFMLGLFTQLMQFEFARSRFDILRNRVMEFLNEAGLSIPIATDHKSFIKTHAELFTSLHQETQGVSRLLGAYFFVGSSSAALAAGYPLGERERKQVSNAVSHILEITPIEKNPWARFLRSIEDQGKGVPDHRAVDAVLSPCLNLVAEVIRQLPDDHCRNVCFVAMPFKEPYLGYYSTLFAAIAHGLGCVPTRAWGGLSSEIYISLLYQLVRRAETVIADVSDVNVNVIHEVGLAHGMGKTVHMVRLSDRPKEMSNLMGILVFEYASEGENWPAAEVSRYFAMRSLVDASLAFSEGDAPRDPKEFWKSRREHGGLEAPVPEPGAPPFIAILPSIGDEEESEEMQPRG